MLSLPFLFFPLHQEDGAIHFLYEVQFLQFIHFFFTFFLPRNSNSVTFSFVYFSINAKYNLLKLLTFIPGSINVRRSIFCHSGANVLFKLAGVPGIAAENIMIIEKVMKVYLLVDCPK